MSSLKTVVKLVNAPVLKEGAGFTVRRPIGHHLKPQESDPFLMLDELPPTNYKPGQFAGAPWHPHRGFDTVMYMKQGEGHHHDSMGNSGVLRSGDCQWMTAGSGLMHDEGKNHPGGILHGFQLWVNLPKAHKMDPPSYQDIQSDKIPVLETTPGVKAKIIAGECRGVKAVVTPIAKVQYIDFMLNPNATFTHSVPLEMDTTIVYAYTGKGKVCGKDLQSGQAYLLDSSGTDVSLTAEGQEFNVLLLAGKKLKEPVAWHGPFVMNTEAEIEQAFADYEEGKMGRPIAYEDPK